MIRRCIDLHETFFENDLGNKIAMGIGLGITGAVLFLAFLLF